MQVYEAGLVARFEFSAFAGRLTRWRLVLFRLQVTETYTARLLPIPIERAP